MNNSVQGFRQLLSVGGFVFNDPQNVLTLFGQCTTANYWATLRKDADGSGYQVPSGYKLRLRAARLNPNSVATSISTQILYGDTDVGFNSAAAPTTPVYCGASGMPVLTGIKSTPLVLEEALDFYVPSLKYPCAKLGDNTVVCFFGYLEPN